MIPQKTMQTMMIGRIASSGSPMNTEGRVMARKTLSSASFSCSATSGRPAHPADDSRRREDDPDADQHGNGAAPVHAAGELGIADRHHGDHADDGCDRRHPGLDGG